MDIRLLTDAIKRIKKRHKLIVIYVPHEIDDKTIEHLRSRIDDHYHYSEISKGQRIEKDLIVNEDRKSTRLNSVTWPSHMPSSA